MITVVGLGPAGPEHLSRATLEAIETASRVVLRTTRHPAADHVRALRPEATSFDERYDEASDFEALYDAIVEELLATAAPGLCYVVPGSPLVGERTVEMLRERAAASGVELRIVPALSFVDLALARLGIDPLSSGVRLIDAGSFAIEAAGSGGPFLVAQAFSLVALSSVKLALEDPWGDERAVLLHHLGLPDEVVSEVPWAEIDRSLEPDHLTSLYVPRLGRPPGRAVESLLSTVRRLRAECPWDREQTHRSLVRYLIEECYEAIEAIDELADDPEPAGKAAAHLEEELGDLLVQVLLHSAIAEEEGLFSFREVATSLEEKLVSRHPHVFGGEVAKSAADVLARWEQRKDAHKARSHLFEGIPASLPSLSRAEKMERKLASAGSGFRPEEHGAGLSEEVLHRAGSEEEAGRVLLAFSRAAAARGVDPESALRRALDQMMERQRSGEERAARERADGNSV